LSAIETPTEIIKLIQDLLPPGVDAIDLGHRGTAQGSLA
jgi:hypothetical protein